MRDKVLEHLNRGHPRGTLVGDTSLTACTHDHVVVHHAVGQHGYRAWVHLRVGVNLYKEASGIY